MINFLVVLHFWKFFWTKRKIAPINIIFLVLFKAELPSDFFSWFFNHIIFSIYLCLESKPTESVENNRRRDLLCFDNFDRRTRDLWFTFDIRRNSIVWYLLTLFINFRIITLAFLNYISIGNLLLRCKNYLDLYRKHLHLNLQLD